MRIKTLALMVLPVLTLAGCATDLAGPGSEPADLQPPSLEIVSADDGGVVMSVSASHGASPVYFQFATTGGVVESVVPPALPDATSVNQDRPRFIVAALLLAVRVWAAVETIRVCALPVYQELRRSGSISQRTTEACITEAAVDVTGGILAKLAIPTVKITPLRNSIKSMLGNVITNRQLQKVINKKTKSDIVELVREMTKLLYDVLVKGYQKAMSDNGIK